MIEVKNLTKRYGDHDAVKNLNFKIVNGKIYGLLGPNGAGKSTTMNMMTGCLAPTAGTVNINGFDIYDNPVEAKKCIGYLPEQPPLYTEMTPEEYLTFVAQAKGVAHNRASRQVREVMELTRIEDMKDRLIRNLSKGYKQRVGIAQAMLGNPEIIILDEPTVGLDPKQIIEIRDLIRHLGHSRTVIISSHILSEISEICDEILVIAGGELIASGTQEELQERMGQGKLLHLVIRGDEEGVLSVLSEIEGAQNVQLLPSPAQGQVAVDVGVENDGLRDAIFFAMAEHKYAVLTMELEEQSLEKIFLTLTDADSAKAQETPSDEQMPAPEPEAAQNEQSEEDETV
ncbi:MAG: ABC transporter ATP-binding protein [Clostridia bacterium]|nr:ABC transporter ATP-binding protein [Clostridia bacterium]